MAAAPSFASDISGAIRVIDGDTFDVGTTRVRLHGIDAPEARQTCGDWRCGAFVTSSVRDLYAGRQARCTQTDTDRYGRAVARCHVDGVDVGAELVQRGLAVAFVKYSRDYVALEKAAAQAARGIHAAAFQRPTDYRASQRRTTAQPAPNDCVIKGNISGNGARRIYHMPGQRDYAATRINTRKGERFFCTEAEARAAGWRAAKR